MLQMPPSILLNTNRRPVFPGGMRTILPPRRLVNVSTIQSGAQVHWLVVKTINVSVLLSSASSNKQNELIGGSTVLQYY